MRERFIYVATLAALKLIYGVWNLILFVWLILVAILAILNRKMYNKMVNPIDHREHKL